MTRTVYRPRPFTRARRRVFFTGLSGEINVTPTSLDYGSVTVDTTSDDTVTVQNTGNGPLTVTGLTGLAAPYTIVADVGSTKPVVGLTQLNSAHDLAGDVLAVYLFHEGAGRLINDYSGSGNNASVVRRLDINTTLTNNAGVVTQGYTTDGTKHWVSHTTTLERWSSGWILESTDAGILTDTALTGTFDHVGDIAYGIAGDKVYAPIDFWNAGAGPHDGWIGIYDDDGTATLSGGMSDAFDISAQMGSQDLSGICIDEDAGTNGIIYCTSFKDMTEIQMVDLSDGSDLGSITLSRTISGVQGIALKDGEFWVSVHLGLYPAAFSTWNQLINIGLDGELKEAHEFDTPNGAAVEFEGIDWTGDNVTIALVGGQIYDFILPTTADWSGDRLEILKTGTDYVFTPFVFPDNGTMVYRLAPRTLYNFNSVWDTSENENDWESWIYSDGDPAARTDGTAIRGTPLTATVDADFAFTWTKDTPTRRDFFRVNGVAIGNQGPAWLDPAGNGYRLYIGGGNDGNAIGDLDLDYFYVFDRALTTTEIDDLQSDPFALVATFPNTPFTIAAGGADVDITIRFSPTSVGTFNDTLVITSDDIDEATVNVPITGAGAGAVTFKIPQGLSEISVGYDTLGQVTLEGV